MNPFELIIKILVESWLVFTQMAPYLIFGFLVAGILSVVLSPEWVERHLGGRGLAPIFTASLVGVPLPLCSCGVIPVSVSIRRHGASRAATAAFLISTPQTGVDSIAVTYAMLGPVFTVFRPIAALLTGVLGGLLVHWFGEREPIDEDGHTTSNSCTEACCSQRGRRNIVIRALRYGLFDLPRDIGPALALGVLIAGAIATFVPKDQLHTYVGGGVLSILLLMAVGVPVYVCATASVPIAAGFIYAGVSPGAALAFLIAGPATNAATLTTIWKVLGRRTMILYGITIAASAVACGLLLDWLSSVLCAATPTLGHHVHRMSEGGWFSQLAAILLILVLVYSYFSKPAEGQEHADEDQGPQTNSAAERLILRIGGMTCDHCVHSVTRALHGCAGVRSADVRLAEERAVVIGSQLDPQQLVAAVTGLGYTVEEVRSDDAG